MRFGKGSIEAGWWSEGRLGKGEKKGRKKKKKKKRGEAQ